MKLLNDVMMFLLCAVFLTGCSSENKPASSGTKDTGSTGAVAAHTHGAGPNGGVVFDLGSHHAEFTVDHNKKECTILVLGVDEKTPNPVAAAELILNINETKTADGKVVSPMTITLKPVNATDGKTATFVGTDPGIGNVADFGGTVSGEVDDKPAQGDFQE